MNLGLIGLGPWGKVYAKTLTEIGVNFWQAGKNWRLMPKPDAAIVACRAEEHFKVARALINDGVPVLIEKPLCLNSSNATALLRMAIMKRAIVYVGHTRLYSNAWHEFKAKLSGLEITAIRAEAGGKCRLEPLWDWGSHLVAMCLDLDFDPLSASISIESDDTQLKLSVNGEFVYTDQPDSPRPLEILLQEFMAATKKGKHDIRGLELGVRVVKYLEAMEQRRKGRQWRLVAH